MTVTVNTKTMLTTAVDETAEALEAGFLRGERVPGLHPELMLLPAAELSPPGVWASGAADDRAQSRPTVRTSNSRCC